MKNARNSRIDKQKIFSLVISFGIIVTLAFGIYSVVNNVKQKNNYNVLDLKIRQLPTNLLMKHRKMLQ